MIRRTFEIKNKLGLHARPAALFVQSASQFKSKVKIIKDGLEVDGKSIMGIMMLAAAQGMQIDVTVDGEDEQSVMQKIEELIQKKFDEDE
ncbi:MAG: HPr family phosphocarrier protein [Elusimicrobiota bacterium]